ncbi:MAG TPA: AarF/ABC1/UbiB kinase family protein [Dissulfurispiraceae bacterium]|nr:AarF/ABC1/UbiB kinase family protein [Dissulfurispiraceae bacterium]
MELARLALTYKSGRRLQHIVNVFLKYGFGQVIDQITLGKYIPFRNRLKSFGMWPAVRGRALPERLRMAFAELGPTFIKLAQLLASRPDLITVRFADEFKKLQDEVPSFPAHEARRIIEEELRVPMEKVFGDFEETPVAAASIAQVHRARLADGARVVVKVQRPKIREDIESDISIMSAVARLLERYLPESRMFNPVGIVNEFSRTVRRELDFMQEARHCARFRKNFAESTAVCIPRPYMSYATERVFVMEMVEGIRIDDVKTIDEMGIDRKTLARTVVNAYLKQILEDGFFHADPHPGNIFVMPDGMIAFVDFGIVGRISDALKETLANTFLAIIRKDFERLVEQYIELGIVPDDRDLDSFRKEFKAELAEMIEPLYGLSLNQINVAEYLDTVIHLAIRHNLKIPSDLLLIDKALLILENIARQLDPEFDVIGAAEPFASRFVREKMSPSKLYDRTRKHAAELGDFALLFPRQLRQLMKKALKDDIHLKMYHVNLPEFIKDLDKASNRIAFAIIVSSIILSSSILHATGVLPTVYGLSFLGITAFLVAVVLGVWLIISIIRSGRL